VREGGIDGPVAGFSAAAMPASNKARTATKVGGSRASTDALKQPLKETTPLVGGDTPPMMVACCCYPVRERSTGLLLSVCVTICAMLCKEVMNAAVPTAAVTIAASLKDSRIESDLTGLGDVGYAIGKGISVYFVARDPRYALMGACFTGSAATYLFAIVGPFLGFYWMGAMHFIRRACAAMVWASSIMIMGNWVDGAWAGRTLAISSIAQTVGGSVADQTFGAILAHYGEESVTGWVVVFVLAGTSFLLCGFGILLLTRKSAVDAGFAPPKPVERPLGAAHYLEGKEWRLAALTLARSARVWLTLAGSIAFIYISNSFLSYGTLYADKAFQANALQAATLRTMAFIGFMLGGVGGGLVVDYFGAWNQLWATLFTWALTAVAMITVCVLSYDEWEGMSTEKATRVMGSLALFVSVAIEWHWDITMNCFFIAYGGASYSGPLVAVVDTISFCLGIPVSFWFGHLLDESSTPTDHNTFILVATISAIAGVSFMVAFALLNLTQPREPQPPEAAGEEEVLSEEPKP